jgi:hypothetical protein
MTVNIVIDIIAVSCVLAVVFSLVKMVAATTKEVK